MPQTIDHLTGRLETAIEEAGEMLDRLRRLLPEPESLGADTGTIGRHPPKSSEPWNSAAADAYWNLWFGPATLVNFLRGKAGLRAHRTNQARGGDGLSELRDLAPGAPDDALSYVIRKVERWVTMAQSVPAIDESEPWAALPARPGARPPECPYCHTFGLRMLRRKGEVRCFFPGCTDADGMATRARMEPGRMTGEERLVFGDGTMLHFREAQ
jgi:hypothetical protein